MRGSTAGLAEGTIETRNTMHNAFLVFLDVAFASVIVGPVVVIYWRGTWNLMTLWLYPDDVAMSAIGSCFIGTIGHFVCFYCQDALSKHVDKNRNRLTFMIVSRLYTAIYGLICVNGWRGPWALLDIYSTDSVSSLLLTILIATVLLIICKGLRNITSAPFGVSTDHSKDYFVAPTMFKSSVRNPKAKHGRKAKKT